MHPTLRDGLSAPVRGEPPVRPGVRRVGERAALIEYGSTEEVHEAWRSLQAHPLADLEEVVAGARTLLLRFARPPVDGSGPLAEGQFGWPDPYRWVGRRRSPAAADSEERPPLTIPVRYGGPDLESVAHECGVGPEVVVSRHSAAVYTVGFLGFSPGFAYLVGGPAELAVPRLRTPRTSVPAGSVALADGMTAIYPQSTPGGWRIIGRTSAIMFRPDRVRPALLGPGDRVRFEPVSDLSQMEEVDLRVPLTPPSPGRPAVEVLEPGVLLTVQDCGRRGWAHVGVPAAGAADAGSARLANRLVGNPDSAAVLEATAGRCRLRMAADRLVAVTGADAELTVDGLPARLRSALPLRAGTELALGPCRAGLRAYVAVHGGFDTPLVLGSRSTDTLSGLGPAPLRAGDRLALGAPTKGATASTASAAEVVPPPQRQLLIEARWGPRQDWLSDAGRSLMAEARWTVSPASDRTGVRLDGPQLPPARAGSLPSEGMVPGAVQLPPSGRPIVLMRNHPPTGGYPVVAVVGEGGVDELAQARPGTIVSFFFQP